jgi:two-component system, OmpR family, phosphate regulon response regulator PhoB
VLDLPRLARSTEHLADRAAREATLTARPFSAGKTLTVTRWPSSSKCHILISSKDHHAARLTERASSEGRGRRRLMARIPAKPPPARILVVEDERDIAALVAYHLTKEGYRVRTAEGGEEALRTLASERPDLLVLDLMLPNFSGYDILAALRRRPELAELPVVVLTARRDEEDRIRGLELGADDYVTKPFSPRELVLRVGAVLRRAQSPAVAGGGRTLRGGAIVVDLDAMRASANGMELDLTPIEFRLLTTLLERRGRVQSRQQLLEHAWDIHARIETRTVDMHVQRLRAKLGDHGWLIETVRGFGYRFRPRDEVE